MKERWLRAGTRVSNPSLKEVPEYYTKVLRGMYRLMMVYFLCLLCYTFLSWDGKTGELKLILPFLAGTVLGAIFSNMLPVRWNLLCLAILTSGWLAVAVLNLGWNCGVQHLIIPMMIVSLFSIYDYPQQKVLFCLGLLLLRLWLYQHCLSNDPVIPMQNGDLIAYQVVSTTFLFVMTSYTCLIFSSNIQSSEKKLIMYNRELQEQAATDPLTKLHNRRRMLDIMEARQKADPKEQYSVAIGDIDLFKNINDTYGHIFGDLVLKELAVLFREKMQENGYVCRWGGEEFLFYFPGRNLDSAGQVISEIGIAARHLKVQDKDISCSVTMTFGVEEYDFHSPLETIIKKADDKLYYGKRHGRNQVVC